MSVRAMTWVWEHSTTAGNERMVLLAIADTADDAGGNAWPSVATLARKTRLDVRTVQRVVRRLVDGQHLRVETAAARGGTNVYTLIVADGADRPTEPPHHLRQSAGGGILPGVAQAPPSPPMPPHPRG